MRSVPQCLARKCFRSHRFGESDWLSGSHMDSEFESRCPASFFKPGSVLPLVYKVQAQRNSNRILKAALSSHELLTEWFCAFSAEALFLGQNSKVTLLFVIFCKFFWDLYVSTCSNSVSLEGGGELGCETWVCFSLERTT